MKPESVRIVVDTNVFVAAKFNAGSHSRRVIEVCIRGKFQAFYSPEVKGEVQAIVYQIRLHQEFHGKMDEFFKHATRVDPSFRIDVCRDAGDNRVLECAIESQAGYVITNDRGLLQVDGYQGIRVVSPAQFYLEICLSG